MDYLFFLVVIFFSAIIHEYMHGWVADVLGDPTARYAGRLTLNPMAHIDPFGTVALPILMFLFSGGRMLFAYAKPVPYNPYNLKYARWGPAMVGLAGPGINLTLALIFGLAVRFLPASPVTAFFAIITYANILLGIFNLVPIPPLDGSKLLASILPNKADRYYLMLEQYGMWILIFFIFFGFSLLVPIMQFLFKVITGTALF